LDSGLRLHGITFAQEAIVSWLKKSAVCQNGTVDEDLWEENCGENFSPCDCVLAVTN